MEQSNTINECICNMFRFDGPIMIKKIKKQ